MKSLHKTTGQRRRQRQRQHQHLRDPRRCSKRQLPLHRDKDDTPPTARDKTRLRVYLSFVTLSMPASRPTR